MRKDFTVIAVIVDRSGSMQNMPKAEAGVNAFIESQRGVAGDCELTLVEFDDSYNVVCELEDINNIKEYKLQPRGMTALRDAIGKTVVSLGQKLSDLDESFRPEHVVVVIMTDGYENASIEFSAESVKSLIEQQQRDYSWEFVFLGANQDAILTGGVLGINANNSISFAGAAVMDSYMMTGSNVAALRSGTATNLEYTDDQRARAN